MNMFFGRSSAEWTDIYKLLAFRKVPAASFKDLFAWVAPNSPQGCMDLAFELAQAREEIKDVPVYKWIENMLINREKTSKGSGE